MSQQTSAEVTNNTYKNKQEKSMLTSITSSHNINKDLKLLQKKRNINLFERNFLYRRFLCPTEKSNEYETESNSYALLNRIDLENQPHNKLSNFKNLSANAFWFYICSNYFPYYSNELIFHKDKIYELLENLIKQINNNTPYNTIKKNPGNFQEKFNFFEEFKNLVKTLNIPKTTKSKDKTNNLFQITNTNSNTISHNNNLSYIQLIKEEIKNLIKKLEIENRTKLENKIIGDYLLIEKFDRDIRIPENLDLDIDYHSKILKRFREEILSKEDQQTEEEEPDDIVCFVCGDGDYEDDNLIVYCSKCNIKVHQKCYGIMIIPEEDWECHLCKAFNMDNEKKENMECILCPNKGGAMKPCTVRKTSMFYKNSIKYRQDFESKKNNNIINNVENCIMGNSKHINFNLNNNNINKNNIIDNKNNIIDNKNNNINKNENINNDKNIIHKNDLNEIINNEHNMKYNINNNEHKNNNNNFLISNKNINIENYNTENIQNNDLISNNTEHSNQTYKNSNNTNSNPKNKKNKSNNSEFGTPSPIRSSIKDAESISDISSNNNINISSTNINSIKNNTTKKTNKPNKGKKNKKNPNDIYWHNNIENDNAWVHLSCALWTQELNLGNFELKEKIKGVENLHKKRILEQCDICLKSGYGPTIKCEGCEYRFHPECARRLGHFYLEINENENGETSFLAYCNKDAPKKYLKKFELIKRRQKDDIKQYSNLIQKDIFNYNKSHEDKKIGINIYTNNLIINNNVINLIDKNHKKKNGRKEKNKKTRLINKNNVNNIKNINNNNLLSNINMNSNLNEKSIELNQAEKKQLINAIRDLIIDQSNLNIEINKKDFSLKSNTNIKMNYYDMVLPEKFSWYFLKENLEYLNGISNYEVFQIYINTINNELEFKKQILKEKPNIPNNNSNNKNHKHKKNKKNKIKNNIATFENNEHFCYCKSKNNENEQWVACDSGKLECPGEGWYHYKCIPELQKYSFEIINKEIDKYYCPECRKMFGFPNTLENYEMQKKIKENNNEKNKENDKMDIEEDEPDENYYQINDNCIKNINEEK